MAAPQLYPSFTTTYHNNQYPTINPTQPSLDCSDRIVLITGAGRGIGQAIALGFAQAHAQGIALLARTKTALDETAAEIQRISSTTKTICVPVDITATDTVPAAIDAVVEFFGRPPDILINNAGGNAEGSFASLVDVDIQAFWRTFELNVKGPLAVAQAFGRAHKKVGNDGQSAPSSSSPPSAAATRTVVIGIASGGAHLPYAPTGGSYSCSKVAGAKVVEYLHHEHPEWNVFNLQPGVVATELARQAGRKAPDSPELPAGMAVWLAASKDARELNGRFLWANWDIDEVLKRKEEIQQKDLLTLTLKGWGEDVTAEELKRRAKSVHRNADKE